MTGRRREFSGAVGDGLRGRGISVNTACRFRTSTGAPGRSRSTGKGGCTDRLPLPVDVGAAVVDYLDEHGAHTVTIEHAVSFAVALTGVSPRWHALHLPAIRCFTRWADTVYPGVQIPRPGCCPLE
jgi:hypothetical protein